MLTHFSSIVNEVIRGNFTNIERIKSTNSQASDFLPLRYFYAHSDFFPLRCFYVHSDFLPLRRFICIVVIFVFVRLFDVFMLFMLFTRMKNISMKVACLTFLCA